MTSARVLPLDAPPPRWSLRPSFAPPVGSRGLTPPREFRRALEAAGARIELPAPTDGPRAGRIRRLSQTDPAEYDSREQARVWGGSTCSVAALTAVLRGGGVQVRISDVLQAMRGGVTVERGLVSRSALVGAAARFGLAARDDVTDYATLRQVVASGQPVLVDLTNDRFPEGHWLVVTGLDVSGARVVDSSGYNLSRIPLDEFRAGWSGRGIRVLGPNAPVRR